jgi:hypothetical protein
VTLRYKSKYKVDLSSIKKEVEKYNINVDELEDRLWAICIKYVNAVDGVSFYVIQNQIEHYLQKYDIENVTHLAHLILSVTIYTGFLLQLKSEKVSDFSSACATKKVTIKSDVLVYPTTEAFNELASKVGLISVNMPRIVKPTPNYEELVHNSYRNVGLTKPNNLILQTAQRLSETEFIINKEALE